MTDITVTVDDAHLGSIATVARRLTALGMTVDRVLPRVGFIIGSIPAAATASALRSVPGVASVDYQITHRISPPGFGVQ